jgi:hypothetical protein
VRLERLRIRNFKTFADATIDLAPATVLVGANDSGKSAIIDALSWLFSGVDRHRQRPDFFTHVFESKRPMSPREFFEGKWRPTFVTVAGEFGELSDHERLVWDPILDDGRLVFARRLDEENDGAELHVVVSPDSIATLARNAEAASALGPGKGQQVLDDQYFEKFDDGYWLSLETLAEVILDDELSFWPKPWPEPYLDFPKASDLVLIRGPEFGADAAKELLRPLIARVIRSNLLGLGVGIDDGDNESYGPDRDRFTRTVVETADEAIALISEAYSTSLPRWATDVEAAVVYRTSSYTVSDRLIDVMIGDLAVDIVEPRGDLDTGRDLDEYGAGTKRAGAIAALDLFRDPDIWPTDQSVVLAIEEPEVGLHPAAQRRVAAALNGLHTFGVQTVVITHSPIFVNAAPEPGLRLVRANRPGGTVNLGSMVVRPEDLGEIVRELGAMPSDVLLARTFIVVEGESDALILTSWARAMGGDLRFAGVQVVPAGGHGTAGVVARFLSIAYEGAEFLVLLDQGRDTEKTRREIESRFGDRVKTRLLAHLEIEGYFAPAAVERWLIANGARRDHDVQSAVQSALSGPNYKRGLRDLTERLLDRQYRVVIDGAAIAISTQEEELNPEIRGLLSKLLAGESITSDGT